MHDCVERPHGLHTWLLPGLRTSSTACKGVGIEAGAMFVRSISLCTWSYSYKCASLKMCDVEHARVHACVHDCVGTLQYHPAAG